MRRARGILAAALAALLGIAPGCVRFRYSRVSIHEPVPAERLEPLERRAATGEVELQACLDRLGAPLLVWEVPAGIAMAYGWRDEGAWNVNVSWAVERFLNLSLDYSSAGADLHGVVLQFDDDLRLVALRRGFLRDLVPQPRRPSTVSDTFSSK